MDPFIEKLFKKLPDYWLGLSQAVFAGVLLGKLIKSEEIQFPEFILGLGASVALYLAACMVAYAMDVQ